VTAVTATAAVEEDDSNDVENERNSIPVESSHEVTAVAAAGHDPDL